MKVLRNRAVAWLLTVVLVVSSALLGAYHSLSGLRQQAQAAYYSSGVAAGLEQIAAACYNLTTVSKAYLKQDDVLIANVLAARQALLEAQTPGEQYERMRALLDAATLLSDRLERLPLSERDERYRRNWRVTVESELAVLSRNEYNVQALDFNYVLEEFPANTLAALTGVEPLELYA